MTIFIVKLFLIFFAILYVFILFAGVYLLGVEGFLLHSRDRYYQEEDNAGLFYKNDNDVKIFGRFAEKPTKFR